MLLGFPAGTSGRFLGGVTPELGPEGQLRELSMWRSGEDILGGGNSADKGKEGGVL